MKGTSVTRVYRDYDQAGLDFQYDNQAQVPDPRRYLDWYPVASEAARARVPHEAGIAYGPQSAQKLDVFFPDVRSSSRLLPVVVFIHGGAWKALGRTSSSFAAETFTSHGALYVALGFSLMPLAGNLDEMVAQVRSGIAWLHEHIASRGGDPERIHVLGHSSGAHLAAMIAVTDWPRLYSLPSGVVRSVAVISGMYDLEPVRLSYRNTMLNLDRAAEVRNSPARNLPTAGVPLLVGYGELETDEFKRQAIAFHEMWAHRFGNGRLFMGRRLNHYEIAETLANSTSNLSQLLLRHFELIQPRTADGADRP